jgi:hypothetical protein
LRIVGGYEFYPSTLGYEPSAKAYWVLDPVAQRIHVSRDIVFDEDASWPWGTTMATHLSSW